MIYEVNVNNNVIKTHKTIDHLCKDLNDADSVSESFYYTSRAVAQYMHPTVFEEISNES